MGYKTFGSMNIAVIGTGKMAAAYATGLAMAGHYIYIAAKGNSKHGLVEKMARYDNIVFCSIENAAAIADLIVIATLPEHVREVAYWLGDVRGKVIIDAIANISSSGDEQVNTSGAIKAITGSQHVVKVFSTRGYEQLLEPLFRKKNVQLILAGNSKKAKEITKILSKGLGISHFMDFGDDETIPLFDQLTKCWRSLAEKTAQKNKKLNIT
jgi:predicted dinucleotide-binding enzyme